MEDETMDDRVMVPLSAEAVATAASAAKEAGLSLREWLEGAIADQAGVQDQARRIANDHPQPMCENLPPWAHKLYPYRRD